MRALPRANTTPRRESVAFAADPVAVNLTVPDTSLVVQCCLPLTVLHVTISTWPAGPWAPVGPFSPCVPVAPFSPAGPVAPALPSVPVGPSLPVAPSLPAFTNTAVTSVVAALSTLQVVADIGVHPVH